MIQVGTFLSNCVLLVVLFEKGLTNFALRFGQGHSLPVHHDKSDYEKLDEKLAVSPVIRG